MTEDQAEYIRVRFFETEGWEDLRDTNPLFVRALEALPNEELMNMVNVFCREMFLDAKKEAERRFPSI